MCLGVTLMKKTDYKAPQDILGVIREIVFMPVPPSHKILISQSTVDRLSMNPHLLFNETIAYSPQSRYWNQTFFHPQLGGGGVCCQNL